MVKVKLTIIYPTDPLGDIPGGTDTCIRDILRYSPDDIDVKLIGVSADPISRPEKKITRCFLGNTSFDFYPVSAYSSLNKRMKIPLSARFTLALLRSFNSANADIFQFHRIEPALLYYHINKPKIYFIHQNMRILYNKGSDIRWKHFPKAYFALENILFPKASMTYVVRENAVENYRQRFPKNADQFRFLPTWLNPDLFFPISQSERRVSRSFVTRKYDWNNDDFLFISVGRLDHQKNPLLQIDAMALLKIRIPKARLLMVGDGVLRSQVERRILKKNLSDSVVITGVLGQQDVAKLLQTFDTMVLSSAYEGMPRCVIEALGCGIPVVTTDVGEISRVVYDGINGIVVSNHKAEFFAEAMAMAVRHHPSFAGDPCLNAVRDYTAPAILESVYETYRKLSANV